MTAPTPASGPVKIAGELLIHFVNESLRAGADRADVQRTLDRRIVTVIGEKVEADADMSDLQTVLATYVETVNLLNQAQLDEVTA